MPGRETPSPAGPLLHVRVQPRARRNEGVGWQDDALRVRVTAPPADGQADGDRGPAAQGGPLPVGPQDVGGVEPVGNDVPEQREDGGGGEDEEGVPAGEAAEGSEAGEEPAARRHAGVFASHGWSSG